jgi:hypothetical protein
MNVIWNREWSEQVSSGAYTMLEACICPEALLEATVHMDQVMLLLEAQVLFFFIVSAHWRMTRNAPRMRPQCAPKFQNRNEKNQNVSSCCHLAHGSSGAFLYCGLQPKVDHSTG